MALDNFGLSPEMKERLFGLQAEGSGLQRTALAELAPDLLREMPEGGPTYIEALDRLANVAFALGRATDRQ